MAVSSNSQDEVISFNITLEIKKTVITGEPEHAWKSFCADVQNIVDTWKHMLHVSVFPQTPVSNLRVRSLFPAAELRDGKPESLSVIAIFNVNAFKRDLDTLIVGVGKYVDEIQQHSLAGAGAFQQESLEFDTEILDNAYILLGSRFAEVLASSEVGDKNSTLMTDESVVTYLREISQASVPGGAFSDDQAIISGIDRDSQGLVELIWMRGLGVTDARQLALWSPQFDRDQSDDLRLTSHGGPTFPEIGPHLLPRGGHTGWALRPPLPPSAPRR